MEYARRKIILFDGVCNLCQFSVRFIIDRDPLGHFEFASLQSAVGQRIMRDFGQDPQSINSVILVQEGKMFQKSTAALQIAKQLSGGWPLFYWVFGWLPIGVRDPVYNWIARNRYSWFGQQDACRMPTPELRARFLDQAPT